MKQQTFVETAIFAGLVCAGLAAALPAQASNSFRCGNALVRVEQAAARVVEICGEPDSIEVREEPVWVQRPNGTIFQNGTTKTELWRYQRGRYQFPAVLTIVDGIVKEIEFVK